MPAKQASLALTNAYQGRMLAIRDKAQVAARQAWAGLDPDDLDGGGYQPDLLALNVTNYQREAEQLSVGYLAAFVASELDERVIPPPVVIQQAGKNRAGSPLARAFLGPLLGVKVDIKEGKDRYQAVAEGGRRLVREAGEATNTAAREALRMAMEQSEDVQGYRRAIKGTCPICMGKAESSVLPPGQPLDIHKGCQCTSEPQVIRQGLKAERYLERKQNYRQLDVQAYDAALAYQGPSSQAWPMNRALRGTAFERTDTIKNYIAQMDQAMDQLGPIGERLMVYRGTKAKGLKDFGLTEDSIGATVEDLGFQSTSTRYDIAQNMVSGVPESTVWELEVDPQVKGLFVNAVIQRPDLRRGVTPGPFAEAERELVLERGCRLQIEFIRKVRRDYGEPFWAVKAKVLPPKKRRKLWD